jgi:hypothetical protein
MNNLALTEQQMNLVLGASGLVPDEVSEWFLNRTADLIDHQRRPRGVLRYRIGASVTSHSGASGRSSSMIVPGPYDEPIKYIGDEDLSSVLPDSCVLAVAASPSLFIWTPANACAAGVSLLTRPCTHKFSLSVHRADVRYAIECVAKLHAERQARNIRIRLAERLNRCCAFVSILESVLLISIVKIVLQHIPIESGHSPARSECSIFPVLAERRKQLAGTMSGGDADSLGARHVSPNLEVFLHGHFREDLTALRHVGDAEFRNPVGRQ